MANNNKRNQNQNDGQMTVQEAGRKGGEATSNNHGREFYEEIGRKGGEASSGNNQNGNNNNGGKMSREEGGRKGGEASRRNNNSNNNNKKITHNDLINLEDRLIHDVNINSLH